MNKSVKPNKSQELNFSLIVIVLVLFCSFLMVIATFTQLKLYTIENMSLKITNYIPQIPTVLFIAGLLGKRYGILSVSIYILIGLFLAPVFALGGGLDYILNINFGYLLGFIGAIYVSAKLLENKSSILWLLISDLSAILTIHIIGIAYLTTILLFNKESFQTIIHWIYNQSFDTLITDICLGFAALCLGKFIKTTLKKIA